jgi:hypothetical protein
MTSVSDGMIAFWKDRLDEDEAAAKAATPGPWLATGEDIVSDVFDPHWRGAVAANASGPDAALIALHDPARTLREVEAGRKLLADYEAATEEWVRQLGEHEPGAMPAVIQAADMTAVSVDAMAKVASVPAFHVASALERVIAQRAAVWVGHPDYRAEWAPGE